MEVFYTLVLGVITQREQLRDGAQVMFMHFSVDYNLRSSEKIL